MRRGDRWMACVTAAGAVALAAGLLMQQMKPQALEGELLRDGKVIESFRLDGPRTITVRDAGGFNTIKIEKGAAAIVSADCPDKACIRMGRLTKPGAGAVCLPHRLVLRIKGAAAAGEVDGGTW